MKTLKKVNRNLREKFNTRVFLFFFTALSLLFLTTSCSGDNDKDEPVPKAVVMFGIDYGEGDLKATVNEKQITSPTEVELGKTVVFNATHSKSYKIKYWKINGVIIRSVEPTQSFQLNTHLDVRVAFVPYTE